MHIYGAEKFNLTSNLWKLYDVIPNNENMLIKVQHPSKLIIKNEKLMLHSN